MSGRYVVAPQAALDLYEIWLYVGELSSVATANRIEEEIRSKLSLLAGTPGAGHSRRDLTDQNVRFFPVYSYLIVYRPDTTPLQVVAILHGRRDLEHILRNRS